MTRGPSLRVRLLLILMGLVLALVTAEIAYRVHLRIGLARSAGAESFPVVSRPIYALDDDLGYRYLPGSRALRVLIHEGVPVDAGPLLVNALGDVGRVDPDWSTAELRILVVGDSFTANPFHGITWTDTLAEALEERLGQDVAVRNLGRDGYGVLQMVHLAARAVPELQPHLLVIAFIAEDLTRSRFRRFVEPDGVVTRLLTTYRNTTPPRIDEAVDMALVDSRVTGRWADSARRLPNDPLLRDLIDRHRQLALDREGPSLFTPTRSYLLGRILKGGGLNSLRGLSSEAYWPELDFRSDAVFQQDMARLATTGTSIALVLLPTREDLQTREHKVSDQMRSLLQSLELSVGRETEYLLPYMRIPADRIDRMFLLPYDRHPNPHGARVYGFAIAQALIEGNLLPIEGPPEPGNR